MTETPQKVKLKLGNLDSIPPKYPARVKLLQLGRQNIALMRQKPAEAFKIDDVFKEAFGFLINAWRSVVHLGRNELGVDFDSGTCYLTLHTSHTSSPFFNFRNAQRR